MDTIFLQVDLDKDQIASLRRIHWMLGRRLQLIYMSVTFFSTISFLVSSIVFDFQDRFIFFIQIFFLLILGGTIFGLTDYIIAWFKHRKGLKKLNSTNLVEHHEFEFGPNTINFKGKNVSLEIEWGSIIDYSELKDLIIINQKKKIHWFIVRTDTNTHTFNQVRNLVKSKLRHKIIKMKGL